MKRKDLGEIYDFFLNDIETGIKNIEKGMHGDNNEMILGTMICLKKYVEETFDAYIDKFGIED